MERLKKVVSQTIVLLINIEITSKETVYQLLETKLCQNYALAHIRVVFVIKNLKIVLVYGNINKNVKL
jgi:hypothetical protein